MVTGTLPDNEFAIVHIGLMFGDYKILVIPDTIVACFNDMIHSYEGSEIAFDPKTGVLLAGVQHGPGYVRRIF